MVCKTQRRIKELQETNYKFKKNRKNQSSMLPVAKKKNLTVTNTEVKMTFKHTFDIRHFNLP